MPPACLSLNSVFYETNRLKKDKEKSMMHQRNIRYAVILSLCLALTVPPVMTAGAETPPREMSRLWEKAARYMAHHHWVPGNIVEHEKTFNLKGKLEEETRVVLALSPGDGNTIRLNLLNAEENGKDVSHRARSVIESHVSLTELTGDSPFTPTEGQTVSAHYNGRHRQLNGRECSGFDFIFNTGEATIEGTAWLDQITGLPLEVHSRIVTVPFMHDDVKITSLSESEYYALTDQGDCLLDRSLTEMDIAVPKLWFKGRVNKVHLCKDHWKYISVK
jgi:hypothetical protein